MNSILSIQNLSLDILREKTSLSILRNIDLEIQSNEFIGLVGESGSGKSMLSFALMGLLPPRAHVKADCLKFNGQDFLNLKASQKRQIYGRQMSMIFQDASSALNPVMTIEQQIAEVFEVHTNKSPKEIRRETIELLEKVRFPNPEQKMKSYPYELSGGLAQRVMIAIAIALKPLMLIADEPTTALDVTIQSEILDLMLTLQRENQMSVLFISHDLALVSKYANRIFVIYAGEIMESGVAYDVIHHPKHPYTQGLLNCMPTLYKEFPNDFRLPTIPGQVKPYHVQNNYCLFVDRCKFAGPKCKMDRPSGNPKCFFPLNIDH